MQTSLIPLSDSTNILYPDFNSSPTSQTNVFAIVALCIFFLHKLYSDEVYSTIN